MKDNLSYLGAAHAGMIEDLYEQYQQNSENVDFGWRKFFEGFDFQKTDYSQGDIPENVLKEFQVIDLINGYRTRGHLFTATNPVRKRRIYTPTLDIENFGLSASDLNTVFQAGEKIGIGPSSLKAIIEDLEKTYCESIGIEYMYIREPERLAWIRERIELKNRLTFTTENKKHLFNKLNQATGFEQFMQRKFVGQKRFSLEGCEVLIPALDTLITTAANNNVKEFAIGMAHRGRLNTIANIFNKPYTEIFNEFYGKDYDSEESFDGDVKYHLGYSNKVKVNEKEINGFLLPNPSHLEAVGAVAEGLTRARLDGKLKSQDEIIPIIIHGDAAVAGQGVVYESVQMAGLDGYHTGGTIHMVINNQVGFTTNYLDARTSTYCTDVGKVTLCPIFHVNADDIEAVIEVMHIAFEYRQKFHRDVFIDLLSYRKYGHNEGDEPKFTQPKLYKAIASHPNPREIYCKQLLAEGIIDDAFDKKTKEDLNKVLEKSFDQAKKDKYAIVEDFLKNTWKKYPASKIGDFFQSPDTSYDKKKLVALAKTFNTLPEDKNFFRKVKKLMNDRLKMIESDKLDWAMGELLAYATLLTENHPVRISGQDVERGTFSHRHAVLKTEDNEEEYLPLNNLGKKQANFTIYNSLLSEYGVLGFEYGYAMAEPNGLTVWEAQFGDFFNGAQIMIDQFISSGESKWRTQNGLVMLLPHGYEGMGSEHSSGRIERFLQLCAKGNMQVTNCTTPANYFHLLRRQLKWKFRKPLIVFTPKKLLRYPKAVSTIDEMANGRFQEVIDDTLVKKKDVDTVVFCTGKVYYDILEEKEKRKVGKNIAIVRLEQLYPYPENYLQDIVKKYGKKCKYIWMQEEPANMGAWSYMLMMYKETPLELISRPRSGSPASGSSTIHLIRYNKMMDQLFTFAK